LWRQGTLRISDRGNPWPAMRHKSTIKRQ
jgi:hypothetical protein